MNKQEIEQHKLGYVQLFEPKAERFIKIDGNGLEIAIKTTPGPYKGIPLVSSHPNPTMVQPLKSVIESKHKKPRKVNYLNNKDLLVEVANSKELGKMNDKLAHMLQTLAARYGRRSNLIGYTYNDDMQAFAMLSLVKTWKSFNANKSQNPFAFFTQCIKNSFVQYLNQEKKQRNVRDVLLVNQGLAPSLNYQMQSESAKPSDDILIKSTAEK